ncbi:hypothetical protein Pmani_026916 [Petrolisthes manimaculis]|uniref:BTB domain-containing protein n=1 Tax=Petrolisthes manimaculis TaxID=1843537 RepID=A0AAE1P4Y0_9EUCA|nr:hypothetical protein Pmani_026916 [Petrolisthes manimaculis]
MDTGQQFCLRWNNYQSTLQHVFHKLWVSGTFVDVSLVVEGRRLDCHKVVLSACSSYFEHILRDHSNHPHPLILLHDLPYSAVEALVVFMYRGEVNVSQEQLAALLRVAETLRVKGLADSATISRFTKRQMLERCIPLLEQANNTPSPIPLTHTPIPSAALPIVTPTAAPTLPITPASTHHPRMTTGRGCQTTSGCINLSKSGSRILKNLTNGGVKRVEGQTPDPPTSPGPKKKRPRSEEPAPFIPTSFPSTSSSSAAASPSSLSPPPPPVSQVESLPTDFSQPQPSPENMTTATETLRQEAAEETDGELQIDETAGQSPATMEPTPDCDPSSLDVKTEIDDEELQQHIESQDGHSPTVGASTETAPPHTKQETIDHSHQQQYSLSMEGKERGNNIGGKSCERTYTHLDLEEGIEAVLLGHLTPAKAIAQYRIPRRTFFRRLSAVRKSRGIPSAKENAADHFLTGTGGSVGTDTQSSLIPTSESDSYAASFKIKSERPVLIAPKEDKNKGKKTGGDGVMVANNSYFSLLNLAASNKYDAYLNYLKLVAQQGDNSSTEEMLDAIRKGQNNIVEGKPAVDDNRNVSESALALVTNNVSTE